MRLFFFLRTSNLNVISFVGNRDISGFLSHWLAFVSLRGRISWNPGPHISWATKRSVVCCSISDRGEGCAISSVSGTYIWRILLTSSLRKTNFRDLLIFHTHLNTYTTWKTEDRGTRRKKKKREKRRRHVEKWTGKIRGANSETQVDPQIVYECEPDKHKKDFDANFG